jgi:hypothetical protein
MDGGLLLRGTGEVDRDAGSPLRGVPDEDAPAVAIDDALDEGEADPSPARKTPASRRLR